MSQEHQWYNEIGVESWERRAAARIGVVLPGGETTYSSTVAAADAAAGYTAADERYRAAGFTTERLWVMNAGGGAPKANGGTRVGTPRAPGTKAKSGTRPHSAAPLMLSAAAAGYAYRGYAYHGYAYHSYARTHALSTQAAAPCMHPGEAQRDAVRSAVSYFYRFAERHIDGESSAALPPSPTQTRTRTL